MSNKKHENVKIVAFVGLPGAGKSSAVDYLTEKHYPKVYFGGVIYAAMDEAGIERTAQSETIFREEIREKEGKDFVVNRIVTQIENLIDCGERRIVADGLYTWTEYKILKRAFGTNLEVVAIVAPRHVRHHRLTKRVERPYTIDEATKRDWAEIEHLEKGGPIAIADHYVINDSNLEHLYTQVDTVLEKIDF